MKKCFLYSILALILCVSCTKEELEMSIQDEGCSAVLDFDFSKTGLEITKSAFTETIGTVYLCFYRDNKFYYRITKSGTSSVRIDGLLSGNYTVYAYANCTASISTSTTPSTVKASMSSGTVAISGHQTFTASANPTSGNNGVKTISFYPIMSKVVVNTIRTQWASGSPAYFSIDKVYLVNAPQNQLLWDSNGTAQSYSGSYYNPWTETTPSSSNTNLTYSPVANDLTVSGSSLSVNKSFYTFSLDNAQQPVRLIVKAKYRMDNTTCPALEFCGNKNNSNNSKYIYYQLTANTSFTITMTASSESNYDFGWFSTIVPITSYTDAKNQTNCTSVSGTVSKNISVSAGQTFYIGYVKDGSSHSNSDKVTFTFSTSNPYTFVTSYNSGSYTVNSNSVYVNLDTYYPLTINPCTAGRCYNINTITLTGPGTSSPQGSIGGSVVPGWGNGGEYGEEL